MTNKTRAELKEEIRIWSHNYQVIKEMHENGYRCSISEIKRLKDELEYTRKALEQSEICCSEWEKQALDYKAENIALSGKLEIVVDKLKSIKTYYDDCYGDPNFVNWHIVAQRLANDADEAIKVITALE